MTVCKCHVGPLLGVKWPQKCTPRSNQMGVEELRTAVLTWPLPYVAWGIRHLFLKFLFQVHSQITFLGGNFVTGKYKGTWYQWIDLCYLLIPCIRHKSVRLWTTEVSRKVGVQMAVEELSIFSALNEPFLELSLSQCFLSPHDLPLTFSSQLV